MDIPTSIRWRIFRNLHDDNPGCLLPYELLQGLAGFDFPEHAEIYRRLDNVVQKLVQALAVSAVPYNRSGGLTNTHEFHQYMLMRDLFPISSVADHFSYYVAGGFVVSDILGFPPYRDIDVFFQPHWSPETRAFSVVHGKYIYPVSTLMVNDLVRHIETFDFHICQCAIKCEIVDGETLYSLMLTASCAVAWMHQRVHNWRIHLAIMRRKRLSCRLRKYSARLFIDWNLHLVRVWQQAESNSPPWDAVKNHFHQQKIKSHWILTLKGDQVASVTFRLGEPTTEISPHMKVRNDAGILYPCCYTEEIQKIAYKSGEVHWFIRTLVGTCAFTVAVQGVGLVWSYLVKPTWLLERSAMGLQELLREVRGSLPRVSVDGETEEFAIHCTTCVECLVFHKDWITDTDLESAYGPWTVAPCTGSKKFLRSKMFCSGRLEICHTCVHDRHTKFYMSK